jgi:hypothetical protein
MFVPFDTSWFRPNREAVSLLWFKAEAYALLLSAGDALCQNREWTRAEAGPTKSAIVLARAKLLSAVQASNARTIVPFPRKGNAAPATP